MKHKRLICILILIFVLCLILSMFSINPHTFSFPVNVFLLLGLIFLSLIAAYFSDRFRFIFTKRTVLIVIFEVIGVMILHWLFYHRLLFNDLFPSAVYEFSTSALFVTSWMFFLWVLGAMIINRIRLVKKYNIVFLCNHVGLWIALAFGFFGQADSYTLQTIITKNHIVSKAYTKEGVSMDLPFEIGLEQIKIEKYASGETKSVDVKVFIGKNTVFRHKTVGVNHPYRYKGYDIYLQKVGNESCVIQIVYDPWRYIVLIGILSMIVGAIMLFFNGFKQRTANDRME